MVVDFPGWLTDLIWCAAEGKSPWVLTRMEEIRRELRKGLRGSLSAVNAEEVADCGLTYKAKEIQKEEEKK